MADPPTFYANVTNLKITPNEMVFEFGATFPESAPAPGAPLIFDPAVRVVLSVATLPSFAHALQQAVSQVEKLKQAASPQEPTLKSTTM
jgi:Protein of unknown function (DUF3467)